MSRPDAAAWGAALALVLAPWWGVFLISWSADVPRDEALHILGTALIIVWSPAVAAFALMAFSRKS